MFAADESVKVALLLLLASIVIVSPADPACAPISNVPPSLLKVIFSKFTRILPGVVEP